MASNKVFISALILSLAGHGLALGIISFSHTGKLLTGSSSEPIIVHLADAPERPSIEGSAARDDNTERQSLSILSMPTAEPGHLYREETIILERDTSRYEGYLVRLRDQIDREWRYPYDAESHDGLRTAVVRFTISGQGDCIGAQILRSSGNDQLDRESIRAVQSSAPFEELPKKHNLDRLNVIAEFNYGPGN
ncbi:MAG: TonB family protein [Syntrophales bacterium]|nr:TonB family protein [Syntrophales bacterium]